MKKLLTILLFLACCVGFSRAEDYAVPYEPDYHICGDFKYVVLENGTAEITEYLGNAADLAIPAELDGIAVTGIGDSAFTWSVSLISVTIPDSVAFIGKDAFSYCRAMTSITIPDSVTSIGDYAFCFCFSLPSIMLPDSVSSIGANPFEDCDALTDIVVSPDNPYLAIIDGVLFSKPDNRLVRYPQNNTDEAYVIPEGTQQIGEQAFYMCAKLKSIAIPDTVTVIGNEAFIECDGLKNITIPDSVTAIGDNPFKFCMYLTEIIVSENHPSLEIVDGVLFSKADKRLVCYPNTLDADSYSVPDGTMMIGSDAFCSSRLVSIVIPNSVNVIGESAFYWCHSLSAVTIPDSVTFIGEHAFCACSGLTSVTVPNGVTAIGNETFKRCISLTSVNIPDGVTSIGHRAFYNCNALSSIAVPESVTSIGDDAFSVSGKEEDIPNPILTVVVSRGSFAEQYCTDNGISCICQ